MHHTHAANCGPPSPPSNGYIMAYTSTQEGAKINITCFNEENHTVLVICSHDGSWQPNPTDNICNLDSGTIQYDIVLITLGACARVTVVVLCICLSVITVAAIHKLC